jgi:hypothetical protein
MSILDRLGNKAESWGSKEEPLAEGDRLVGKVVALNEGESTFGEYPIIEVEVTSGTEQGSEIPPGTIKAWHVFDTVAKNEVARKKPAIGDEIGAQFIGVQKTKPGSTYDSYRNWHVLVEKTTGAVDAPNWDAHAASAAEEGVNDFAPFPDDNDIEPF